MYFVVERWRESLRQLICNRLDGAIHLGQQCFDDASALSPALYLAAVELKWRRMMFVRRMWRLLPETAIGSLAYFQESWVLSVPMMGQAENGKSSPTQRRKS